MGGVGDVGNVSLRFVRLAHSPRSSLSFSLTLSNSSQVSCIFNISTVPKNGGSLKSYGFHPCMSGGLSAFSTVARAFWISAEG